MTARAGDRVMAPLARLLLRVFFRRIDVEGAACLPAGPVLLVANHVNGLVDGLVLMAVLPRYPRFLGKATLYRILPLAPFLHLAGVVPVHRANDADRGGRHPQDGHPQGHGHPQRHGLPDLPGAAGQRRNGGRVPGRHQPRRGAACSRCGPVPPASLSAPPSTTG